MIAKQVKSAVLIMFIVTGIGYSAYTDTEWKKTSKRGPVKT